MTTDGRVQKITAKQLEETNEHLKAKLAILEGVQKKKDEEESALLLEQHRAKDRGQIESDLRQIRAESRMRADLAGNIREALRRINRGVYGSCRICEGDILPERLKALPETDLCVACSSNVKGDRAYLQDM